MGGLWHFCWLMKEPGWLLLHAMLNALTRWLKSANNVEAKP